MKRLLSTIAVLGAMTTMASADSLEQTLMKIEKQADQCIQAQNCTQFVMANPLQIEVMGNPAHVKKLLSGCPMGSVCYSLSARVSQKVIQSIQYIK